MLTHWFNNYPSSPGSLYEKLQMKRKIIFRLQCGSYLLSSLKNYIYYIIQTFQNTDEKLKFVMANDLLALGSFRRNITTQIIWLFCSKLQNTKCGRKCFPNLATTTVSPTQYTLHFPLLIKIWSLIPSYYIHAGLMTSCNQESSQKSKTWFQKLGQKSTFGNPWLSWNNSGYHNILFHGISTQILMPCWKEPNSHEEASVNALGDSPSYSKPPADPT